MGQVRMQHRACKENLGLPGLLDEGEPHFIDSQDEVFL